MDDAHTAFVRCSLSSPRRRPYAFLSFTPRFPNARHSTIASGGMENPPGAQEPSPLLAPGLSKRRPQT